VNPGILVAAAAGLGAAFMYLVDPEHGRRRRALMRDKLVSAAHETENAVSLTSRDVANRARGTVAELRSWVVHRPPSDHVIAERVRSRLGFLVSHPRSLDVGVEDGLVRLRGPVLADEVSQLLVGVSGVRGVKNVINELQVHQEPGSVPGLQGQGQRARGRTSAFMQTVWSPTARLTAGVAGLTAAVAGLRRGGLTGATLGLGGTALLARGVTNLELKRLVGLGAGRRAVVVQKTITANAPVEEVFAFWSRYENFSRFMAHVRDVRRTADGRSHWVVAGPAGVAIEWDTEETKVIPNELLAWRTLPSAHIQHAGIVRFDPTPAGGTRLDIRLSYNPPGGALGHAVAALLGDDPKRAMDEDLVRFKSLIEVGKATAHGQTVTRDELTGRS
jgi:uncharacterized membrane protein